MAAKIKGTGDSELAGLLLDTPLAEAEGGTGLTSNPLGVQFTSAEQTITAAGLLTIPHGLGASPSLIQLRAICKTAELNYSVDDEVVVNPAGNDISGTSNRGFSIVLDATNLNIRIGDAVSSFTILDKTTGAAGSPTNANWKLIVRAWK